MKKYVMAFDAGTNSTRAILFDRTGNIVSMAAQEFPQIYPKPGWVEHNPMDIWNTQITVAQQALTKAGASRSEAASRSLPETATLRRPPFRRARARAYFSSAVSP